MVASGEALPTGESKVHTRGLMPSGSARRPVFAANESPADMPTIRSPEASGAALPNVDPILTTLSPEEVATMLGTSAWWVRELAHIYGRQFLTWLVTPPSRFGPVARLLRLPL